MLCRFRASLLQENCIEVLCESVQVLYQVMEFSLSVIEANSKSSRPSYTLGRILFFNVSVIYGDFAPGRPEPSADSGGEFVDFAVQLVRSNWTSDRMDRRPTSARHPPSGKSGTPSLRRLTGMCGRSPSPTPTSHRLWTMCPAQRCVSKGSRDPMQRANVIAFLRENSDDPPPLPSHPKFAAVSSIDLEIRPRLPSAYRERRTRHAQSPAPQEHGRSR